jgi:aspartate/tyrosine/aromatic aminotransferase
MEIIVATSYSKSFTIYGERVGSLHFTVPSAETRSKLLSQMSYYSRAEISTPPAFGAAIVGTILSSPELKQQWLRELDLCAQRIKKMRTALYSELKRLQTPGDWTFLLKQVGMFSYTGFTVEQVRCLREDWHVHLLDTGRVNIAGCMFAEFMSTVED